MLARHEAIMKQHEEGQLVSRSSDSMHAATVEAKVDAIAALLDEVLAQ